ncbi:uncharacterized protein LOC129941443 [Eupeodes corollae]|uniref:uncharacterized protein LOC129941443 n=1 Tax=Eupeodes corollae TaxID=290404 RepID=UPI002490A551|nr:uncharacterized protein LOC129941443 [Eupeodes corollae]
MFGFKVWADFKSKTKKKLVENEVKRKQSVFNDNNLVALTEFEEAIVRITSLKQSVEGISARVFGIIQVEESETVAASTSKDVSMASCLKENLEPGAIIEAQEKLSVPFSNRANKDTPVKILQKQNEVQEVFFAELSSKLDDIKDELHRMNRYIQKADDTQKKMYEENRRHNLAVEKLMREKLELKKKVLDVQLDQVMAKLGAT